MQKTYTHSTNIRKFSSREKYKIKFPYGRTSISIFRNTRATHNQLLTP